MQSAKMRCDVIYLRNFQDEVGCIAFNLLKSVSKVLRASRKEGIATVQSWKNKSGNKSFCGLNREAVAYWVDTTQFKVDDWFNDCTGVDNILAELVQAGGEDVITVLMIICNKIWQTGEWPTPLAQSLVITLPKKGNLQQCQNYQTINLISHPSKVMLKMILNRFKPQAEKIIAEEQAGRKEHQWADFQPTNPLWEISPVPARPLPCLRRRQEGLRQGLACSFVGIHEEVHQHQPYSSHQKPVWQDH